jgi:hypothetical protein
MVCPRCGSSEHVTVEPGVAECRAALRLPDAGEFGPGERFAVCGTRYQVPLGDAGLGLCWCNMQALGKCTRCGQSVCLDHLRRVDDRVVCLKDYEAHEREVRAAHGRDVQSAWEEFTAALDEAKRTGLRGAPDRTSVHHLSVRTGASLGQVLNAPTAGALTESQAARLRVGDPCPLHRATTCTIRELATRGRLARKTTGAACAMPLWHLAVLARLRQGAEHLCTDSRGTLVTVLDGEPDAHPLPTITPGFFKNDLDLLRSATRRLRALTG